MARGDVHFFQSWDLKAKSGVSFNLTSDSLFMGIVTNAVVPTTGTGDPRWGSGGTTNFLTNQVATGGSSYTGPIALTSVSWTAVTPSVTASLTSGSNQMTVTAAGTPGLAIGCPVTGTGIPAYCTIAAFGTGTGGTGTYTLSQNATATNTGVTVTGGSINKLSFGNVSLATDASGFTNGYYGVIYDNTTAGAYAIGFVDLGGPINLTSGSLNVNLNSTLGMGTSAPT